LEKAMILSPKTLVPAIVLGGTVLGLLAATEVNTRMKAAPEPEWRSAAREAALNAVSYAVFDSGPSDLSPHLPWIGTGPDGDVAMFPEDLHRSRAAYMPDDYPQAEAELALAQAEPGYWQEREQRRDSNSGQFSADIRLERDVVRAAETVRALESEDMAVDRQLRFASRAPALSSARRMARIVEVVEPPAFDSPVPPPELDGVAYGSVVALRASAVEDMRADPGHLGEPPAP
jgi:hypothetical protein